MSWGNIGARPLVKSWTARDYVQDGLVAMWDGIENAGWGMHDANATVWTDLVRPIYAYKIKTVSSDLWESDSLLTSSNHNVGGNYDGGWYFADVLPESEITPDNKTFEAVVTIPSVTQSGGALVTWCVATNGPLYLSTAWGYLRFTGGGTGNYGTDNNSLSIQEYVGTSWKGSLSIDTNVGILYNNGVQARNPFSFSSYGNAIYPFQIGNAGQTIKIHSVRVYSRALTASEIAANYAVDKLRFNLP